MKMKKLLISLVFLCIAVTVAYADFQENYPACGTPVSSLPLRTNLDQLWADYQQLTNNSFSPTINGMTVAYSGGKICSASDGNVYTLANGNIDFSSYSAGSILYVSVIASGGTASLSIDSGSYNPSGIPLWTVSVGSSLAITSDDRAWVKNTIGLPFTTSGILKASSGSINTAVAGTDYLAPTGNGSQLTGITASQVGGLNNVQNIDTTNANNISSGTLAATRGGAGTVNGIMKANGSGVVSAATSADYAPATSGTAILKGNGTGGFTSAVAGTDYVAPAQAGNKISMFAAFPASLTPTYGAWTTWNISSYIPSDTKYVFVLIKCTGDGNAFYSTTYVRANSSSGNGLFVQEGGCAYNSAVVSTSMVIVPVDATSLSFQYLVSRNGGVNAYKFFLLGYIE